MDTQTFLMKQIPNLSKESAEKMATFERFREKSDNENGAGYYDAILDASKKMFPEHFLEHLYVKQITSPETGEVVGSIVPAFNDWAFFLTAQMFAENTFTEETDDDEVQAAIYSILAQAKQQLKTQVLRHPPFSGDTPEPPTH